MSSEGYSHSRSMAVFNKSRVLVISGIVAISFLAWVYMVYIGWHVTFGPYDRIQAHIHHPERIMLVFLMWSVMMVAMMVPSAAPTILMFDTIVQRRGGNKSRVWLTILFISGYLFAWTMYSAVAAISQLWFQNAALVSSAMVKSVPIFSAALLITAGLFQFSRLKYACLKHCRSPMGFFMQHWQEGHNGAFLMGLRSGIYCVGCCWALMVLMFVAGAMNIIWMAVLAIYILIEKLIPGGRRFSQLSGLIMMAWGLFLLVPF